MFSLHFRGNMGASLHRAYKTQVIGGSSPYLTYKKTLYVKFGGLPPMTCVLYALWRDPPIFPLKNIENICLSCWTERTLHNASRETIGRARHLFRYPYFMIKWLWIAVHKLIASLFGICRVKGNSSVQHCVILAWCHHLSCLWLTIRVLY